MTAMAHVGLRVGACMLVVAVLGVDLGGYAASGHKWATRDVSYYVNPRSIHVSEAAAVSAVQRAADVWAQQSSANVRFIYAGSTTGTSLTLNRRNEVFFRNSTSGYVAETYWWYDGTGALVDADVVFYEGSYRFFTNSGCISGIYVENVATHEFGHALGIDHSSTAGATMAPSMPGYCDMTQMTLHADDIAAVEAMYPQTSTSQVPVAPTALAVAPHTSTPTSSLVLSWTDNATNESGYRVERSADGAVFTQVATLAAGTRSFTNSGLAAATTYFYRVLAFNSTGASSWSNTGSGRTDAVTSTNTAPAVLISNPLSGASYPAEVPISFSGSATDSQDGSLTATLTWTSSLSGQIGTGGSFSRTLPPGTHIITASTRDSAGATGSRQISMSVTTTSQTAPQLSVRGYRVKGQPRFDLVWSNITATSVDIFRDGVRLTVTANDGTETDASDIKKGGSVGYRVCAAGMSVCTNTATVTF